MRKVFQLEYFGSLVTKIKLKDPRAVKPEDAVFAELDNLKSVYWELGKATEVPPEGDKFSGLVPVKTTNFEFGRK
ncbi:hypothetical protein NPIL_172411 [Nephila pilipes]|uniref:Uncharacterized protein n=1 Tax=Nephila pilipes TaxID=299642 RepID=A0A8X6T7E3_NEPPI|nr:hypothetical protein NPIL_172411 [Nephila pilipes]